ncbi:MAG: GT-D fold domain-containing glycosyltransferase [Halanaerobiales bacterium]|nr:GT-D fold domain-containing glycosyltransferase [Halanaerobiales bacterium]
MNEYQKGYQNGLWYGKVNTYGNIVIEAFPPDIILPGYTIPELLKIALAAKKDEIVKMITPREVYLLINSALDEKKDLSLVRLGDGEGIALAQGLCKTEEELKKYNFLEYAGLTPPDYQARDELAIAIRTADLIGISANLMEDFQPLTCKALQQHSIKIKDLTITTANINRSLFQEGYFKAIIKKEGLKITLVGNKAIELAGVLKNYCNITGIVSPVNGVKGIPRVLEELKNHNFDLLLVSAGIPAVIICAKAAKIFNCVALDFGHMADQIVEHKTIDFKLC